MKWFRIKLIETELKVPVPEGTPQPKARVPSSAGKVYYPPDSYRIYVKSKSPSATDAVIAIDERSAGAIPSDWLPLTVEQADEAIREILGRDPLPGQVL